MNSFYIILIELTFQPLQVEKDLDIIWYTSQIESVTLHLSLVSRIFRVFWRISYTGNCDKSDIKLLKLFSENL